MGETCFKFNEYKELLEYIEGVKQSLDANKTPCLVAAPADITFEIAAAFPSAPSLKEQAKENLRRKLKDKRW